MREYAFLMINYDTPELIKDIQGKLLPEEIYNEDGEEYGLERETHVTLVPCLDNDINLEELKQMLLPIENYNIILNNVSKFNNNEKYDVLKCDAGSMALLDTNKKIREKYPSHSEYTDYNPHVTIAYLNKDMGDKYCIDNLTPLVVLKPRCFHFSYVDKDGNERDEYFR